MEGRDGVIVIDPLISTETAAAGLALYREQRGDRPVTAVSYTHSHVDHFGGVRGVVDGEDVSSGRVPMLAPEGFLQHAVAENVYAGTAMARRSAYMYGAALPVGPAGQLGAGLGMTTSTGTVTLIPPTRDVARTGQEEGLDGVRLVFQVTPGTEAPSEVNFFFPDHGALCMAENATHTLHNLLTFASHHWPTWGREAIVELLSEQRDLYAYQHDQTLRLLNKGYVGAEIAEMLQMPPALENAWHTHGYDGSISHNVKAVYQRYMGWFDGNPAHLWQHPPEQAGRRYVDAIGGPDALLAVARRAYDDGDFRWVAELVGHLVSATRATRPRVSCRPRCSSSWVTGPRTDLAQLLPHRGVGAAGRSGRHRDGRGVAGRARPAHARADLRQRRDPGGRATGGRAADRHRLDRHGRE
ncbi:MAG TPA: alkyl sulfatase dimerization domain-containing protein [Amycolatopsis sp.]|nr:alkyl sulfatase dimerization domain-containing protein [Amycolatopsis sp.]